MDKALFQNTGEPDGAVGGCVCMFPGAVMVAGYLPFCILMVLSKAGVSTELAFGGRIGCVAPAKSWEVESYFEGV